MFMIENAYQLHAEQEEHVDRKIHFLFKKKVSKVTIVSCVFESNHEPV